MATQEMLFEKGQRLFASGHPMESIDIFTKAEKEGCSPVRVALSRGAAYLKVGETDRAIDDFSRALGVDADNERAFYYRGIAHLKKGNYEEAVEDLTRSIMMNHERGGAFFARGLAYAELERTEEALRDMKTAISFSTKEVLTFSNLFGETRTRFDKSMALLEGERGPWSIVLNEEEVENLRDWMKD
jgi:tetratricopeptide (TPR) repeat protein